MHKEIKSCRVCGNTNLVSIINLGEQSLTGIFPKSKEQKVTSGPLELVKCIDDSHKNTCGLVQLRHSYNNTEMYGENYGYRSGLNSSMVSHLQEIVDQALGLVSVAENDLIIDIGSNDATLLRSYSFNNCLLTGIDPTASKFKKYYPDNIKLIPDFFSSIIVKKNFGNKRAKIITSIAMFYDLEHPMDFLNELYEILDDEGVWIFEQSYMPLMLERNAYDTICHEHLEYYGLKQIKWMLDKAGFKIIDIELNDINGGSFRIAAAKKASGKQEAAVKINRVLSNEEKLQFDTLTPFDKWRNDIMDHRERFVSLIKGLKEENKSILGYGASTKGNVLLQFCKISDNEISYIAEVNEDKFGSFTPNTLIPIISEKQARDMNPDYFLILPWHFKENIIAREEAFLKSGGKLIFPLPHIEIVSW